MDSAPASNVQADDVDASTRRSWRALRLVLPAWLTLGVFFLVPLLIVLGMSFAPRARYGGVGSIDDFRTHLQTGAVLANYVRTFDPVYAGIFWRSLWMALATTGLCLLISYPVAYYIAVVAPPRRKNLLLALAVIPFWTSFLVRTCAWIVILRTEGIVNTALMGIGLIGAPLNLLYTPGAVLLGLVYGELPFMILPLYASLEKLDRSLLEASSDLGAGRVATFFRVTVPLTAPGIAAGVLLVFVPSVGQFVVSDLLGGSRSMLVGNLIQNQFTAARNQPFGAAIAFELMLLVLLLLVMYAAFVRRRGGGEELL